MNVVYPYDLLSWNGYRYIKNVVLLSRDKMKKYERTIVFINHLHNIISRMENNCFHIKALCITIVSAAIAFSAANLPSANLILSCSLALIFIFWMLDAKYLLTGRQIRSTYNDMLDKLEGNTVPRINSSQNCSFWATAISWSVVWFYLAVAGLVSSALFAVWKIV